MFSAEDVERQVQPMFVDSSQFKLIFFKLFGFCSLQAPRLAISCTAIHGSLHGTRLL